MNQIADALHRLTIDLTEFQQSLLAQTIDPLPYIRRLSQTVEELEAKNNKTSVPKPPLDPETVWARWQSLNSDLAQLDARELRTLCVSPKTAMRGRLIAALAASPDALKRWINFNGFVQAYFKTWRKMEDPQAAERLIQGMLMKGRLNRNRGVIEVWRKFPYLFSADAGKRLGDRIIRERKSVNQVCTELGVETSSALAIIAHEQATNFAAVELAQRDQRIGQEVALQELRWFSTTLLTTALSPAIYREAISKLILSRLADSVVPYQTALVTLIHADDRLGDPRLAGCAPNWRTVRREAKEKFVAWLAKDTLQFFFDTLVPRSDKNRRRAEFWIEYAKRGKIKDFQVAVSSDHLPRILASRAKMIPSYSSVAGGNTSAFLMLLEGYGQEYVLIEFSETGNAAYIYNRKIFEANGMSIRSRSFHLQNDLKRIGEAEDRIWHQTETKETWESKARKKLAELGIRP